MAVIPIWGPQVQTVAKNQVQFCAVCRKTLKAQTTDGLTTWSLTDWRTSCNSALFAWIEWELGLEESNWYAWLPAAMGQLANQAGAWHSFVGSEFLVNKPWPCAASSPAHCFWLLLRISLLYYLNSAGCGSYCYNVAYPLLQQRLLCLTLPLSQLLTRPIYPCSAASPSAWPFDESLFGVSSMKYFAPIALLLLVSHAFRFGSVLVLSLFV